MIPHELQRNGWKLEWLLIGLILLILSFSADAQYNDNRYGFQVDSVDHSADRAEKWQAVKIVDWYVFVHPRGNADINPQTGNPYDQDNLQKGINWATQQGRVLVTLGKDYYVTDGVKLDKYAVNFIWMANNARLVDIDGGNNALVYSDLPTDMGDANLMIQRHPVIYDLQLSGSSTNIGIDIGATYGASFNRIRGENLDWVVYTRFGLLTNIFHSFATNCTNGFAFGTYEGLVSGATWSNSQSNHSVAFANRWYGNSTGTAFLTKNSSGILYDGNIIEGVTAGKGFEMDAPGNTVVKDWTITRTHLECVNGFGTAGVYARWAGGIITIDKIFSGHATILADIGSTPGYTFAEIGHVPWSMPKAGKIFTNSGNTSWYINRCDNQLFGTSLTNLFQGLGVSTGCNVGGGPNQICIDPINR